MTTQPPSFQELAKLLSETEKQFEPLFRLSIQEELENQLSEHQSAQLKVLLAHSISALFGVYARLQGAFPRKDVSLDDRLKAKGKQPSAEEKLQAEIDRCETALEKLEGLKQRLLIAPLPNSSSTSTTSTTPH
mmetsp:Transcript_17650/g.26261  ORF Transcript_17650/g.26261 Transcript_17650/m.26261 type:complete len:133 (-) Transcript_17650:594-992(-)